MTSSACSDCDTPGEGNCRRCHGEGKILLDKRLGEVGVETPCPKCKGSGACTTCGGTGVIEAGGESG